MVCPSLKSAYLANQQVGCASAYYARTNPVRSLKPFFPAAAIVKVMLVGDEMGDMQFVYLAFVHPSPSKGVRLSDRLIRKCID